MNVISQTSENNFKGIVWKHLLGILYYLLKNDFLVLLR